MKYAALLLLAASSAHADTPRKPAPAITGKISGTVIFEGEAPDNKKLVRDSDPYCAKTPKLFKCSRNSGLWMQYVAG